MVSITEARQIAEQELSLLEGISKQEDLGTYLGSILEVLQMTAEMLTQKSDAQIVGMMADTVGQFRSFVTAYSDGLDPAGISSKMAVERREFLMKAFDIMEEELDEVRH